MELEYKCNIKGCTHTGREDWPENADGSLSSEKTLISGSQLLLHHRATKIRLCEYPGYTSGYDYYTFNTPSGGEFGVEVHGQDHGLAFAFEGLDNLKIK